MNIFYLHQSPYIAAKVQYNKHVVKMILESAQMLCTAHHVYGNKFGCPPGKGYNYKDLTNMLNNIGEYIGKRATFTYFQRTQAGSYRHPLFKCIRNYE